MQENLSPEEERRVYNLIWTGAYEYGFEPKFIGRDIKGEPDFYLSLIIGLAYRKFGKEKIEELFDTWKDSIKRNEYELLAWLAIENYIYSSEHENRDILIRLRNEYALDFQDPKYELYRRRFSFSDNLAYRMYDRGTKEILGINLGNTEKYGAVYSALMKTDNLRDDEFLEYLKTFFADRMSLKVSSGFGRRITSSLTGLFDMRFAGQIEYSIRASKNTSVTEIEEETGIKGFILKAFLKRRKEREDEIADIFGRSMYSDKELINAEEKYCVEGHRRSRLWYTKGDLYRGRFSDRTDFVRKDIEEQIKRNKRKYESAYADYQNEIRQLSGKIRMALELSKGNEDVTARKGKLIGKLAWKSMLPDQYRIFSAKEPDVDSDFRVDILLDASASRREYQEDIAIEGYILSESLSQCNIPVRVISYSTLYEFTVLRILKDYSDESEINRLLSYFAIGWNRDGLAYRGYLKLNDYKDNGNKLLLILTDAMPNDLSPMYTGLRNKPYEGKIGIEDTNGAIAEIRKNKIKIAGIITGEQDSSGNANKLFQEHFVKISSARQISSAAGRFIKKEIERLSGIQN